MVKAIISKQRSFSNEVEGSFRLHRQQLFLEQTKGLGVKEY